LYTEFKGIFPKNAVEYFISYFDFISLKPIFPHCTYIEKDSSTNDEIERMRLAAMISLFSERMSSCIQRLLHLWSWKQRGI
jgi:excinuclease ABC subunit B